MSEIIARQLTRKVAEVARKTAAKAAQIVEGTVISRNPDGSLNVDDGRGGCVRVAPSANVRVGQRIKLGTEPAIGTQTNLPQITVTVSGSTVPCPDDPRPDCEPLVGNPCPTPVQTSSATVSSLFTSTWVDSAVSGDPDGKWSGRLGGGALDAAPDTGAIYPNSPGPSVWAGAARISGSAAVDPNKVTLSVIRSFLTFDTTSIPTNATIVSAKIRLPLIGNDSVHVRTDHNTSLVVMPSTHDGVSSHASNFYAVVPGVILGRAAMLDIVAAGPNPPANTQYDYEFDLDVAAVDAYINRLGLTKLAVLMELDSDPASYMPVVGLFSTGLEVTASGTPDDKVHVASGNYQIDGTNYSSGGGTITVPQQDASGHTLTGSETYQGMIVQEAGGGVILVKGTIDGRNPNPTGAIILSYLHVGCEHGNPSIISDGDIVFEPAARPFTSPGNPNETRDSLDFLTLRGTAGQPVLLVEWLDPTSGGSRD